MLHVIQIHGADPLIEAVASDPLTALNRALYREAAGAAEIPDELTGRLRSARECLALAREWVLGDTMAVTCDRSDRTIRHLLSEASEAARIDIAMECGLAISVEPGDGWGGRTERGWTSIALCQGVPAGAGENWTAAMLRAASESVANSPLGLNTAHPADPRSEEEARALWATYSGLTSPALRYQILCALALPAVIEIAVPDVDDAVLEADLDRLIGRAFAEVSA